MRQPPTGNRFPSSCENADVSGATGPAAAPAHQSDEIPPATSARNARRPYGREVSGTSLKWSPS